MTQPAFGTDTGSPGLTTTSTGGATYAATMSNGQQYTVRQEDWSVKTDYYLDTFVYHLPEVIQHLKATGNPLNRVLEIGVARGVLSIGIALLTGAGTQIVGVDIEEQALALATENARRNAVEDKLAIRIGDFFEPVGAGETFDLVFGELPFIPVDPVMQREYIANGHASEILNVSGGADGRTLIDRLLTEGPALLHRGGSLLLIQPSFVGVDTSLRLLEEQGLVATVLVRKEWRLDDTQFTRQSRGYIESLYPSAFSKNAQGEDVFYLTILAGMKP